MIFIIERLISLFKLTFNNDIHKKYTVSTMFILIE